METQYAKPKQPKSLKAHKPTPAEFKNRGTALAAAAAKDDVQPNAQAQQKAQQQQRLQQAQAAQQQPMQQSPVEQQADSIQNPINAFQANALHSNSTVRQAGLVKMKY